jgi:hypothetical protein
MLLEDKNAVSYGADASTEHRNALHVNIASNVSAVNAV